MFTENVILPMIPDALAVTKKTIELTQTKMADNINYYYRLTQPLHNHKTFNQQVDQLMSLNSNMTKLSTDMQKVKDDLDGVEQQMHDAAAQSFDYMDKHLEMDAGQKAERFDDAMIDFKKSIKLIRNKLGLLDIKMTDVSDFTKHFHEKTDQLEKLYLRDIENRKKYFQENDRIKQD